MPWSLTWLPQIIRLSYISYSVHVLVHYSFLKIQNFPVIILKTIQDPLTHLMQFEYLNLLIWDFFHTCIVKGSYEGFLYVIIKE